MSLHHCNIDGVVIAVAVDGVLNTAFRNYSRNAANVGLGNKWRQVDYVEGIFKRSVSLGLVFLVNPKSTQRDGRMS